MGLFPGEVHGVDTTFDPATGFNPHFCAV